MTPDDVRAEALVMLVVLGRCVLIVAAVYGIVCIVSEDIEDWWNRRSDRG